MTAQPSHGSVELEAKALAAVDRIRAGHQVENDLIESKLSWPQENKARQLAGCLNRAGGDPEIYIIGIDERTGVVHDVARVDVLDWWNQIVPQFDHTQALCNPREAGGCSGQLFEPFACVSHCQSPM
ncbi:hypothetical protein ACIPY2_06620 [Paenarthrobacter sp. NPDC089675]|uniref:hypothetical protein n=1 Tax=Paenarthrobacter sp. NPDC089675 TaxID=3364376 RepID=UPI00381FA0A0